MPRIKSFWRNAILVGAIHAAALLGLARWGGSAKQPAATDILWLDASALEIGAVAPPAQPAAFEPPLTTPAPPADTLTVPVDEPPMATLAPGDLPLPEPRVSPTTRETPPPKPSPETKATPKSSPRPTPKKTVIAKAVSPAPRPGVPPKKPAPREIKKVAVNPAPLPGIDTAATSSGPGTAGANGGGNGSGRASQFGWYSSMLHDRFFSAWIQPTSIVASGAKMSVLVRLRIEKDGRVSNFTVVRPSGNVVVDESVAAVAKRVGAVDPLPAGLTAAAHYDVNINFELNPEQ